MGLFDSPFNYYRAQLVESPFYRTVVTSAVLESAGIVGLEASSTASELAHWLTEAWNAVAYTWRDLASLDNSQLYSMLDEAISDFPTATGLAARFPELTLDPDVARIIYAITADIVTPAQSWWWRSAPSWQYVHPDVAPRLHALPSQQADAAARPGVGESEFGRHRAVRQSLAAFDTYRIGTDVVFDTSLLLDYAGRPLLLPSVHAPSAPSSFILTFGPRGDDKDALPVVSLCNDAAYESLSREFLHYDADGRTLATRSGEAFERTQVTTDGVYVIRTLTDWVSLVNAFPAVDAAPTQTLKIGGKVERTVGLDYAAAAEVYTGIYLPLGGYLCASYIPVRTDHGWTTLTGWHSDSTLFLSHN